VKKREPKKARSMDILHRSPNQKKKKGWVPRIQEKEKGISWNEERDIMQSTCSRCPERKKTQPKNRNPPQPEKRKRGKELFMRAAWGLPL